MLVGLGRKRYWCWCVCLCVCARACDESKRVYADLDHRRSCAAETGELIEEGWLSGCIARVVGRVLRRLGVFRYTYLSLVSGCGCVDCVVSPTAIGSL